LPLGGQARDKDITLTVSFPPGSPAGLFHDTPAGTHAVPLLPLLHLPAVAPLTDADVISVDRNKVEQVLNIPLLSRGQHSAHLCLFPSCDHGQVIRNFVSNALKFAPPASSICVVAYFDPRPLPTPYPGGLRGTSGHGSSSVVGAGSSSSSHGDRSGHGWLSRQAARAHRGASWLILGHAGAADDAANGSLSDNGSLLTGTAGGGGGGGWGRLVVAVTDEGPGVSEPFHGPCLGPSILTPYLLPRGSLYHPFCCFRDAVGLGLEDQRRVFNEIVQFSPEKLQAGGGRYKQTQTHLPPALTPHLRSLLAVSAV